MKNTINQEICIKCKLCIEVCPVNIIGIDKNGLVNSIPEREDICLECGQCMAVCPTAAVKITKYSYEEDFTKLPMNEVDYQKFINFIATRRSIRNFKNKAVSDEIINQILKSVSYAPYGAAPEKINITVVNNRKTIETALPFIAEFLDNIIKWIDNPIASFMIKRKKGQETFSTVKNHLYPISKLENYKLKYGDRITRDAPTLLIFHAKKDAEEHTNNSLIYATYLTLAAHSLGLGTTMIGIVPAAINKVKEVREIFQIPKQNEAIISVIIGYPKFKYKKIVKRKTQNIYWID